MNEPTRGTAAPVDPAVGQSSPADSEEPAAAGGSDGSALGLAGLVERARADVAALEAEVGEIGMLAQQARTEAARHEQKRAAAAHRFAAQQKAQAGPAETLETATQLITLTRRAMLMQSQVDVLEGKLKTLDRFHAAVAGEAAQLTAMLAGTEPAPGAVSEAGGVPGSPESGRPGATGTPPSEGPAASARKPGSATANVPPGMSRMVLTAQEDLRREIARTMHDGPAQSLTNIVLQAQIVERLLNRDPEAAKSEVAQLISMVQQTLEATKSFIFDVRPMVLDDLGLVPTIRRAARERGRRAQIPVDFESFGTDRRLSMELESGLFRMVDEALAAYLSGHPDGITLRLDWSDGLEAHIAVVHPPDETDEAPAPEPDAVAETPPAERRGRGRRPSESTAAEPLPPALAAMIEARRAAQAAANRAGSGLPAAAWREIQDRASSLGITAELSDDGRDLRLTVDA